MKPTARQYATALFDATHDAAEADAAKIVDQFLSVIKEDRQEHLYRSIAKEYRTLLTKKNVLPEVTLRSAAPLDEHVQQQVCESLGIAVGTAVHEDVDPGMIGGIFVKYNNKSFDLSLARRLERLKNHLKK